MLAHLASTGKGEAPSLDDLRRGTEEYVSQRDIDYVDQLLVQFTARWRSSYHLIIESHHVTNESYGFRIAPFSADKIRSLDITEIWILFADARQTISRVVADPSLRPKPTSYEADLHTALQASLAVTYAALGGVPLHLFRSGANIGSLVDQLEDRLYSK